VKRNRDQECGVPRDVTRKEDAAEFPPEETTDGGLPFILQTVNHLLQGSFLFEEEACSDIRYRAVLDQPNTEFLPDPVRAVDTIDALPASGTDMTCRRIEGSQAPAADRGIQNVEDRAGNPAQEVTEQIEPLHKASL
jgi:hypothetical protein